MTVLVLMIGRNDILIRFPTITYDSVGFSFFSFLEIVIELPQTIGYPRVVGDIPNFKPMLNSFTNGDQVGETTRDTPYHLLVEG